MGKRISRAETPSRLAQMKAKMAAMRKTELVGPIDTPLLLDAISDQAAKIKAAQPDKALSPYLIAAQRRAEIARLTEKGKTAVAVAALLGISASRVREVRRELGLAAPQPQKMPSGSRD